MLQSTWVSWLKKSQFIQPVSVSASFCGYPQNICPRIHVRAPLQSLVCFVHVHVHVRAPGLLVYWRSWLKALAVKLSRPSGRSGSYTGLIGFNPRRLKCPKGTMSSHATDLSVYAKSFSSSWHPVSAMTFHFKGLCAQLVCLHDDPAFTANVVTGHPRPNTFEKRIFVVLWMLWLFNNLAGRTNSLSFTESWPYLEFGSSAVPKSLKDLPYVSHGIPPIHPLHYTTCCAQQPSPRSLTVHQRGPVAYVFSGGSCTTRLVSQPLQATRFLRKGPTASDWAL